MTTTKTLLAAGGRFDVIEVEPHGYTVLRLADLASVDFFGDDATEGFRSVFTGDETPESFADNEGCADDLGDYLTGQGEFPPLPPLKTWSVLINWDDNDDEQGNYSWTGQACTPEAAERMAKWSMWIQDHDGDPLPGDIADEFGTVLDCQEGAMWKAADLETALADLLEWETQQGGYDAPCWQRARALLDEIRGVKEASA